MFIIPLIKNVKIYFLAYQTDNTSNMHDPLIPSLPAL
jgi:hypothetical protein